jgi:hypothetical protein
VASHFIAFSATTLLNSRLSVPEYEPSLRRLGTTAAPK